MKDINIPLYLIKLLANGKFYSNEQISKTLGISYSSIQKHIKTVTNWGVHVCTLHNQGYYLYTPLQLLEENIIRSLLPEGRIIIQPITNSTNQYLIKHLETIQSGDACIAEYQDSGRGRYNKQWISPFGNVYLSIYWNFQQDLTAIFGLSLMVSIIIIKVLNNFGVTTVRIKWPNDLYINDLKLAGILVETFSRTRHTTHVIIGIGINLTTNKNTTKKLNQGWINLQSSGIIIDRNILIAELINKLRKALRKFERSGFTPFIEYWWKLDNFLNQQVKLLINGREILGIDRGINIQGALLLETKKKISAYLGENISLRSVKLC